MPGGGDAGKEVLAVDRLRGVTVKACLERCLPISHGRVRGDGNARNFGARVRQSLDRANQRVPVLIRHRDIGDEHVILFLSQGVWGAYGGFHDGDLATLGFLRQTQQFRASASSSTTRILTPCSAST